jgi:hypothetical protein
MATMAKGQGLLEHLGQSFIKGLAVPVTQPGHAACLAIRPGPLPDLGQQRVSINAGSIPDHGTRWNCVFPYFSMVSSMIQVFLRFVGPDPLGG